MIPLRKMIRIAQKNRLLNYDPFSDYEIRHEETERGHLDAREIKALMTVKLKPKQALVRDLYVFCIFTGLPFIDLYTLCRKDIRRDRNGHLWIVKERGKTGVESVVRLMDIPKQIFEKYDGLAENGLIFPVPSYKMLMYYLKIIAKRCGIEKRASWHLGRHIMPRLVTVYGDYNFRQWRRVSLFGGAGLGYARVLSKQSGGTGFGIGNTVRENFLAVTPRVGAEFFHRVRLTVDCKIISKYYSCFGANLGFFNGIQIFCMYPQKL